MFEPTRTRIGPRGRVTIPVAVQRDAGLTEGDEVIIRAAGPGVVVVETPPAVLDRIRAGMRADADSPDALTQVRALRDADAERLDRLSAPHTAPPGSGAGPPTNT
ncbi:AbrB/MazE/SpoVT family DNA-binding domain-containing protein [Streptomyces sp. NPDC093223]|uniref:AbrB/MazE/SpoVT family DNA-binding domain-containing protein n=1 Tax=Streptomyces sp. NPDC093223 TaxID=3366033 RepID=UPI00381E2D2C